MAMKTSETKDLLNALFEEEALVIGGIVALHNVDDDIVWRIMQSLDSIRRKYIAKVSIIDPTKKTNFRRHPAIEEFLKKIRSN